MAAILVGQNHPLVVDSLEIPVLDVGQVIVRVYASGICGAQIDEIAGSQGPDLRLPHLLGHEGGGIVEDAGLGTKFRPGDRVVMHWRKGPGAEARPPKYEWPGNGLVGGKWVTTFNECAVVSENRLTRIENDVPFEVAALMGCAVTTALGCVNNEAQLQIGESVMVAGCGGVGLNIVQAARLAGASRVIGVDRSDTARKRAIMAGAAMALQTVPDQGPKVDVFIDCTGSCEVIAQGMGLLKPGGGRMILVGQPAHGQCLNIPDFRSHYRGKLVMDSQGGLAEPSRDIPRYIDLWRAGRLNVEQFITHRIPLSRVNEALDVVRAGEAGRCILTMP